MRLTTIVAAFTCNRLLLGYVQSTLVTGYKSFNRFGLLRAVLAGRGIEQSFDKVNRQPDDKNKCQESN